MSFSDYFRAEQVSEGVFHIYEPGGVYTTLILGKEKALLIDTGYGFEDLPAFVRTLTDLPVQVVLTHGHTDHAGGSRLFGEVFINPEDIPVYLWYEKTQKKLIVDKFRRDRAAAGLPDVWPESFNAAAYLAAPPREFKALKNGQIFDLGGRREEILFLPGHTRGSVMVFDGKTGLLFSGDNISSSLWIFFDHSAPLSQYEAGLKALMGRSFSGILYAHDGFIYPPQIMEELLTTISRVDPETDRVFIHPRTGQRALKHREKSRLDLPHPYIYVVYEPSRM